MVYKTAYDLDGVLAVQPPLSKIPWRKMKGPERRAQKDWLLKWYASATTIHIPNEREFLVVTARKASEDVRLVTMKWLEEHYFDRKIRLEMLSVSRSIENVVNFKTEVLKTYGVEDYTEDNRKVANALRLTCPETRVWHYKDGKQNLDYDWGFGKTPASSRNNL